MDTQRKLSNLFISYKRDLNRVVKHSKQAQQILIDHYTKEKLKTFKTWDDCLTDINFICFNDLGVGKLIAIKCIKDEYFKIFAEKTETIRKK